MNIDLGDPLRWRDSLPSRQPASSEVAAGAVAGTLAGLVGWGTAVAATPEGLGLLRLVAATLFGAAALGPGAPGLTLLAGTLLAGFASIFYGLVFVSILPPGAPLRRAVLVGAVFGAVLYVPAWVFFVHVFDPLLYQAAEGRGGAVLALHVVFGATLGLVVPVLRKVLP